MAMVEDDQATNNVFFRKLGSGIDEGSGKFDVNSSGGKKKDDQAIRIKKRFLENLVGTRGLGGKTINRPLTVSRKLAGKTEMHVLLMVEKKKH